MNKKIIIIDDSSTMRDRLREVLEGAGYRVVEAGDGLEGLDRIRDHRDAAMVLCDINMPRLNGLDMIEGVLGTPAHAGLPIVMLTTEGQAEVIARGRRAGAKGWIVKPFKPDLLVATVRKIAGPA